MIQICSFLWRGEDGEAKYTAEYVIKQRNALLRHLKTPFEYVCITDDPTGLPSDMRIVPLWDKHRGLGRCYNRLYIFSEDMREIIGDRFAAVDLDVVITGDVTHIFNRKENFYITRYHPIDTVIAQRSVEQKYNGSLIVMKAGARRHVWDLFDPVKSLKVIKTRRPSIVGSDQAWMNIMLGGYERTLGPEHGIYEARNVRQMLPRNAAMVFFSGRRDPARPKRQPWVAEHWI